MTEPYLLEEAWVGNNQISLPEWRQLPHLPLLCSVGLALIRWPTPLQFPRAQGAGLSLSLVKKPVLELALLSASKSNCIAHVVSEFYQIDRQEHSP